jgi:hypothetical protein
MVVTLVTPGQVRLSEHAADATAKRLSSSRAPMPDSTTDVRCRAWVRKKLALISSEALWRDEEHGPVIEEFLKGSGRFFAHVDMQGALRCQLAPPVGFQEVLYLVRDVGVEVSHEKMDQLVQCGVIRGDPMESLLSSMQVGGRTLEWVVGI